VRAVGARHGASPGEVAIAWTLGDRVVTGAIVGTRTPEKVDGWVGAADLRLSADEIGRLGELIAGIAAAGTGVLLVEHHADLIFAICGWFGLMSPALQCGID